LSKADIIRAWKDEEYRNGLSEEERAALPEHPSGMVELPDAELASVAGAVTEICTNDSYASKACFGYGTLGCCSGSWRGAC
jgi:mersacidin/lichenicidin family type 2 lantibiotic